MGIKQHLRIKAFYGTSDNAVRVQVWIAILNKRLWLPASPLHNSTGFKCDAV